MGARAVRIASIDRAGVPVVALGRIACRRVGGITVACIFRVADVRGIGRIPRITRVRDVGKTVGIGRIERLRVEGVGAFVAGRIERVRPGIDRRAVARVLAGVSASAAVPIFSQCQRDGRLLGRILRIAAVDVELEPVGRLDGSSRDAVIARVEGIDLRRRSTVGRVTVAGSIVGAGDRGPGTQPERKLERAVL
jgi:hypothetical protein